MNAPICDINSEHGELQIEPVYGKDGVTAPPIMWGWFCKVKDCDGYGGIIPNYRPRKTDETKGDYNAQGNSRPNAQERESQSKQGAGQKAERQLTYLSDMD